MALLPPQFLSTVLAIGFRGANNKTTFTGTGFLFGLLLEKGETPDKSLYLLCLITNRHVLKDGQAKSIVVRANPKAGAPAKEFDAPLVDEITGAKYFTLHPNPAVDIAAIHLNTDFLKSENVESSFFRSDVEVMTLAEAKNEGISEGDGVFVLGFPLGFVGDIRNYAIVRHGVLARVSDALIGANSTILVDASIFPGNSGGPVILRPEVFGIEGTKAHPRARLIGIVSAYLPYSDFAISSQTQSQELCSRKIPAWGSCYLWTEFSSAWKRLDR